MRPAYTSENLGKEKHFFLLSILLLLATGLLIRLLGMLLPYQPVSAFERLFVAYIAFAAALYPVAGKFIFACLVFRLSRFLRHRAWLTGMFCLLSFLPFLYLVPLVGLLNGVRRGQSRFKEISVNATEAAEVNA